MCHQLGWRREVLKDGSGPPGQDEDLLDRRGAGAGLWGPASVCEGQCRGEQGPGSPLCRQVALTSSGLPAAVRTEQRGLPGHPLQPPRPHLHMYLGGPGRGGVRAGARWRAATGPQKSNSWVFYQQNEFTWEEQTVTVWDRQVPGAAESKVSRRKGPL
ncbi:hypothetical protein VULLAG_LOCUS14474 [Vulpes lagopus]